MTTHSVPPTDEQRKAKQTELLSVISQHCTSAQAWLAEIDETDPDGEELACTIGAGLHFAKVAAKRLSTHIDAPELDTEREVLNAAVVAAARNYVFHGTDTAREALDSACAALDFHDEHAGLVDEIMEARHE